MKKRTWKQVCEIAKADPRLCELAKAVRLASRIGSGDHSARIAFDERSKELGLLEDAGLNQLLVRALNS